MKSGTFATWAAVVALAALVTLVVTDRSPKVPVVPAAVSIDASASVPASTPAAVDVRASAPPPASAAAQSTPSAPSPAPTQVSRNPNSAPQFTLRFVDHPQATPSFSLTSFSGQTLTPATWRGKVVILNFWATWCGPCRYEIPELVRLQREFQGSLQVVGLSVDEAPLAQVKTFIDHFGVNYPVAIASDKLQDEFGGILALPTSFVIDREGRVVQKHVGLVPEDFYATEIAYLAGKPTNARVESFTDVGQIFPANVKKATSLPGVDMTKLTTEQRRVALRTMNEQRCSCGCGYTLAQCRVLDSACPVSQGTAQSIVQKILQGKAPIKPANSTARPASSSR